MSLPPYASPVEKVWFWVFRLFCGLILLFLIAPVLQGLNKPVNDLSRGALVDDIVYTIALTAIQAAQRG